eukprot:m.29863 g.29863  ORF g.29863 m.29863 type:complete len:104 (-) comp12164_c0_seq1:826-1137(-)
MVLTEFEYTAAQTCLGLNTLGTKMPISKVWVMMVVGPCAWPVRGNGGDGEPQSVRLTLNFYNFAGGPSPRSATRRVTVCRCRRIENACPPRKAWMAAAVPTGS